MTGQWDREKWKALGLEPGHMDSVTAQCAVGCILRERERLARIVDRMGEPGIAAAIRDSRMDDLVFKFKGPEAGLDVPPEPK